MTHSMRRLAALSVMAGSAIIAISTLLLALVFGFEYELADATGTKAWLAIATFQFPGAILMLLGLHGLHARQASRAGRLGLGAYVLLFVALSLNLVGAGLQFAILPVFAEHAPQIYALDPPPLTMGLAFLGMTISIALGFILYAIVTIRAKVYPRAAGYVLIAALVFSMAVPVVGTLGKALSAAVFTWLGWDLWRAPSTEGAMMSPAQRETAA